MHRFRRFDATASTLSAQLYADERIVQEQDGIGLYDGKEKDASHDNGRLYLTSHRLIYLDAARPQYHSCALDLSLVRQTEYWAGFLKSSPKITLTIGDPGSTSMATVVLPNGDDVRLNRSDEQALPAPLHSWICRVCGFSNLSSAKCSLCGVVRDTFAQSVPSRASTPASSPAPAAPPLAPSFRSDGMIPCRACTFLNHPSMTRCEMCDSQLASQSPSPPTPSRPDTPSRDSLGPPTTATVVRLSFRKGGVTVFYAHLKKALLAKAWDRVEGRFAVLPGDRMATIGIDGILKTIDLDARERDGEMQVALQDLKALMAKAKEMVQMAQSLNAKLSVQATDASATIVRASLVSLGLPTLAITPDMVAEEHHYHVELAKELVSVLSRSRLLASRGLVSLDEVWCHWNRARGVALVSPLDMRQACMHLPVMVGGEEITLRTFRSGLSVLHTPAFNESAFAARVLPTLHKTTLEIARMEGLSASLAEEMMEILETERGQVCREAGLSTVWWPNLFVGQVGLDLDRS